MSRPKTSLIITAIALAALAAGYLARDRQTQPRSGENVDSAPLLAASLPDLDGRPTTLGAWPGQVRVVNFWATWCPPCREEIPEFIRLQEKYRAAGVTFVGLAIDTPDRVAPYAKQMGINYPILIGEIEAMELARQAGNSHGALPYTVVLDRAGKVAVTHLGIFKTPQLEAALAPLLQAP